MSRRSERKWKACFIQKRSGTKAMKFGKHLNRTPNTGVLFELYLYTLAFIILLCRTLRGMVSLLGVLIICPIEVSDEYCGTQCSRGVKEKRGLAWD